MSLFMTFELMNEVDKYLPTQIKMHVLNWVLYIISIKFIRKLYILVV